MSRVTRRRTAASVATSAGPSGPVLYCVARRDASGRAIPDSRLTDDMPIWEALKELARLRVMYPDVHLFSGGQVANVVPFRAREDVPRSMIPTVRSVLTEYGRVFGDIPVQIDGRVTLYAIQRALSRQGLAFTHDTRTSAFRIMREEDARREAAP